MAVVHRRGYRGRAVNVEGQVLVELVHIESLHGADNIRAEFRDVHFAEVYVLTTDNRSHTRTSSAVLGPVALVFDPEVQLSFGGGGRCWWAMRLPWRSTDQTKTCISTSGAICSFHADLS